MTELELKEQREGMSMGREAEVRSIKGCSEGNVEGGLEEETLKGYY